MGLLLSLQLCSSSLYLEVQILDNTHCTLQTSEAFCITPGFHLPISTSINLAYLHELYEHYLIQTTLIIKEVNLEKLSFKILFSIQTTIPCSIILFLSDLHHHINYIITPMTIYCICWSECDTGPPIGDSSFPGFEPST